METGDLAIKVTALEQQTKSNQRRIDKLEQSTDALTRLATSVEVMATKQDQIAETVNRLDSKVTTLEDRPAKHWDGLVDKAIWAIAGAVLAFLLAKIGL